jgi:hypothetical protein
LKKNLNTNIIKKSITRSKTMNYRKVKYLNLISCYLKTKNYKYSEFNNFNILNRFHCKPLFYYFLIKNNKYNFYIKNYNSFNSSYLHKNYYIYLFKNVNLVNKKYIFKKTLININTYFSKLPKNKLFKKNKFNNNGTIYNLKKVALNRKNYSNIVNEIIFINRDINKYGLIKIKKKIKIKCNLKHVNQQLICLYLNKKNKKLNNKKIGGVKEIGSIFRIVDNLDFSFFLKNNNLKYHMVNINSKITDIGIKNKK